MTTRRTAAILALILLAGCGFFRRVPNTFYSLDVIPPETPRPTGAAGTPIGIDGVELPPGFDRRGIILRDADNKLEVRGTHQWASALEDMVIHTLSFDLANRLPEGAVVLPGQAKPGTMRSLYITFEDLAPGPDKVFVLDARWTMTPNLAGHERITVPLESEESAAVVTAMSRALAQFAERIIAQVR